MRFHIRDDRGRRVPLGTIGSFRDWDEIPEHSRRVIEEQWRSAFWARRSYTVKVIVGAALAGVALCVVIVLYPRKQWLSIVPALAMGLFLVAIVWTSRHFMRDHYPRIILGHRFCPACGHNLAQLDPEEDGCTVCPECGAAWHLAG